MFGIFRIKSIWQAYYFFDLSQMYVDGEENTLVLTGLTPNTEYAVSVFSIIGEESSEPLKGTETTCKLRKCLPPSCFF